jgi:hypothetical protein
LNGSLEEAIPLDDPAPVGFDGAAAVGPAPPPVSSGAERTETMDPPAPRLPVPQLDAADLLPESASRRGPPQAIPIGNASIAAPEAQPLTPIEMRIRRLEDALAQLQQIRAAELRVTTGHSPRPAAPVAPPTASPPHQAPTDKLWDLGVRALTAPGEVARALSQPPGDPRSRQGWLFFESVTEVRAIFRMFTDPRYRLSWSGRIAPLALAVLMLFSWWWVPFSAVPIFGNVLDKAVDLLLAYVLIKLLAHEARRYRETAPDLPPSLRL